MVQAAWAGAPRARAGAGCAGGCAHAQVHLERW